MALLRQKVKIKPKRQITIGCRGFARKHGRYVPFPFINLSGKWLKEHGFDIGQTIDVVCRSGKLVITIAKNG